MESKKSYPNDHFLIFGLCHTDIEAKSTPMLTKPGHCNFKIDKNAFVARGVYLINQV